MMVYDGDFLKEDMNFNVWMGAQVGEKKKYEKKKRAEIECL